MVYHHAESHPQARDRSYSKSDIASCRQTPPFSLQFDIALFRHFLACKIFDFFQLFNFFNIATAVTNSLSSIHLNLYRPSLVASYAPSDAPEPLFTSDFHNRCRKHRCRQILTSGEEILAFLELRICSTNNPSTWQRGLCRILLVNGMQIWYAQCDRLAHRQ